MKGGQTRKRRVQEGSCRGEAGREMGLVKEELAGRAQEKG